MIKMKNAKISFEKKEWAKKFKKYPKPWTQEIHDKFIKDMGLSEKQHKEWHRQHNL